MSHMKVRVSTELSHDNLSFERIEAWEAIYFLATCHHLILKLAPQATSLQRVESFYETSYTS